MEIMEKLIFFGMYVDEHATPSPVCHLLAA
jgi:hypothetical protein